MTRRTTLTHALATTAVAVAVGSAVGATGHVQQEMRRGWALDRVVAVTATSLPNIPNSQWGTLHRTEVTVPARQIDLVRVRMTTESVCRGPSPGPVPPPGDCRIRVTSQPTNGATARNTASPGVFRIDQRPPQAPETIEAIVGPLREGTYDIRVEGWNLLATGELKTSTIVFEQMGGIEIVP